MINTIIDVLIGIEIVSLICIIITSCSRKIYHMDDKKEFLVYAKKMTILVSNILLFVAAINIHTFLMPCILLGKQLTEETGMVALMLLPFIFIMIYVMNRKSLLNVKVISKKVVDAKTTYEKIWELKSDIEY